MNKVEKYVNSPYNLITHEHNLQYLDVLTLVNAVQTETSRTMEANEDISPKEKQRRKKEVCKRLFLKKKYRLVYVECMKFPCDLSLCIRLDKHDHDNINILLQQEKEIERKEAMEDVVGAAVLEQADVGDSYTIATGFNSEMYLRKDTQERLANTEMITRDGSVRMKLKGKFPGCIGFINQQVCYFTIWLDEITR